MKRKDWKIKKLTENTYGKKNKFFLKNSNKKSSYWRRTKVYFLRKLFIRKNSVLIKKNLISNYFFLKKLILSNKKKKLFFLNKFIFNNLMILDKTIELYPLFYNRKKVFNDFLNFKLFLKKNNLNYFSINRFNRIDNNLNWGGNVYLFNQTNNSSEKLKKEIQNEINSVIEKDKNIFILKSFNLNFNEEFNINYYINYNIHLLISLEIYKILILLYFLKINN